MLKTPTKPRLDRKPIYVVFDKRGRPALDIYDCQLLHWRRKDAKLEAKAWDEDCPDDAPHGVQKYTPVLPKRRKKAKRRKRK